MSLVADEVEARVAWLRSLCDCHAGQQGAAADQVDALCIAAKALLDEVVVPVEPEPMALGAALAVVVAAERYLRLMFELSGLARERMSPVLVFAGTAAREGYQHALARAAALGVTLPSGAVLGGWPAPAVLLEPMTTPATYVRGARVRSLGLRAGAPATTLPFPVVMLPWYPWPALRALTMVQHELGHDLDQDLGLSPEVAKQIEAALVTADVRIDEREIWAGWVRELVADAIGVMLAGPAFVVELSGWIALTDDHAPSHPPTAVRVAIGAALLGRLGIAVEDPIRRRLRAAVARRAAEVPYAIERYLGRVEAIVAAVALAPLPALGGQPLIALAPAVAAEHAQLVALVPALVTLTANQVGAPAEDLAVAGAAASSSLVAHGLAADGLGMVPRRLLPSLAGLAIDAGGDPHALASVLFAASVRPEPASRPFRDELFAQRTLRTLQAPVLDEAQDGLKLPSPDLFGQVREAAFVGAINDTLPGLFRNYVATIAAGALRKRKVEIYFLTDAAVRRLANPQMDADLLAAKRQTALDALDPTLLAQLADEWCVGEYDGPYFFAGYWDAEYAGGRIQLSNQGWGQDLKRAPSFDCVWPHHSDGPGRTYRWYRDALRGLRRQVRILRQSSPPPG